MISLRLMRTSAIISLLLVLPFMLFELIYGQASNTDLPIPLFAFMWLLSLAFFVVALSLVCILRTQTGHLHHLIVWPRVVLVVLITWLWVGLVADQMPCFLGVPNCD